MTCSKPITEQLSATRRWPRFFQIAATALALGFIGWKVPWRDRIVFADGSTSFVSSGENDLPCVRQKPSGPISSAAAPEIVLRQIGVASLIGNARPQWFLMYLACALAALMGVGVRWHVVMRPKTGLVPCVIVWARSQVIGLLPWSQIGADLYRVECAARWIGSRTESIGAVTADRLLGAMGLVGALAVGLLTNHPPIPAFWRGLPIAVVAAAVCLMGIGKRVRTNGISDAGAVATWWRRTWNAAQRATMPLATIGRQPLKLILLILLSVCVHVSAALCFVAVDRALGLQTPIVCYLIAVPAVNLALYAPVHIAGLGVIEGGLWLTLGPPTVGRTPAEVLAICATVRILGLLWLAFLAMAFLLPWAATHRPAWSEAT